MNTTSPTQTNTIDWKEKGKNAMAKINATGILNKNYPSYSSNPNESQAALNILNAKYPKSNNTMTNKGGRKRRNKSKRRKSKRRKSKRNKSKRRK
jgi:hypothetical protein